MARKNLSCLKKAKKTHNRIMFDIIELTIIILISDTQKAK